MCHAFFFAFDVCIDLLYRAAGIYNRAVIVEIAWAVLLFFTAFLSLFIIKPVLLCKLV